MKFTHPFNKEKCAERLYNEYLKHKKLMIGFDFDNTIFDCHNQGGDYSCVIELLKKCSELGFIMILYTAEPSQEHLEWKKKYCEELGIKVSYVNEDPIYSITYGTKKPYFNILLDDRCGLEESFEILSELIEKITS